MALKSKRIFFFEILRMLMLLMIFGSLNFALMGASGKEQGHAYIYRALWLTTLVPILYIFTIKVTGYTYLSREIPAELRKFSKLVYIFYTVPFIVCFFICKIMKTGAGVRNSSLICIAAVSVYFAVQCRRLYLRARQEDDLSELGKYREGIEYINPTWLNGIIIVVSYIISRMIKNPVLEFIEAVILIIFVIVNIVYRTFLRLYKLNLKRGARKEFPKKQIMGISIYIMGGVSILSAIVMTIALGVAGSVHFPTEYKFKEWETERPTTWEEELYSKHFETKEVETEKYKEQEEYPQVAIDFNVVGIVIACIACVVFCVIIFVAWLVFRKMNNENNIVTDTDDSFNSYGTSDDYFEVSYDLKDHEAFDRNEQFRSRYKEKVVKAVKSAKTYSDRGSKKAFSDNQLPSEITANIADGEKAEKITQIYEKARYSNQEITEKEQGVL